MCRCAEAGSAVAKGRGRREREREGREGVHLGEGVVAQHLVHVRHHRPATTTNNTTTRPHSNNNDKDSVTDKVDRCQGVYEHVTQAPRRGYSMPFIAMAHLKREESGGVAKCQGMKCPRISGSYGSEGQ